MGTVGLSDAFIYLQRFSELSNGQQYRASLAKLIASGANVSIADEFCANLDCLTANVVSLRLRVLAKRLNAALVVASSQPESLIGSLALDVVLQLSSSTEHFIYDGGSFSRKLRQATPAYRSPLGSLRKIGEISCSHPQPGHRPGFASKGELMSALTSHYPELTSDTWLTVVALQPPLPPRRASGPSRDRP